MHTRSTAIDRGIGHADEKIVLVSTMLIGLGGAAALVRQKKS